MCCIDGLGFPSDGTLRFNLALYLLTYVEKLPWNWTSDFRAALVPVQHKDTDKHPTVVGTACAGFSVHTVYKRSTHLLFLQPRGGLPGFLIFTSTTTIAATSIAE